MKQTVLKVVSGVVAQLRSHFGKSLRSRRVIGLLPALFVAVIIGSHTMSLNNKASELGARQQVYIAGRDITDGQSVTADDFVRVAVPKNIAPSRAHTSDPVGVAINPIGKGEILVSNDLALNGRSIPIPTDWIIVGVADVDPVLPLLEGARVMPLADGRVLCEFGIITSMRADELNSTSHVAIALPRACAADVASATVNSKVTLGLLRDL
jgi:hypothetical protein